MAFSRLREDIAAARAHDPAADSNAEVFLAYSGLHAIWGHRVANWLWRRRLRLAARVYSQLVRFATGVEIHPGATLGRRLFIDHGMGVVIGETAVVGDDVVIYHGVTLGGTSSRREIRHPRIGNGVVIGAGASVLGAISIGDRSIVGANAVVVRDAPADSVITGIPARARPRVATSSTGPLHPDTYTDPAIYI
ncbi:serine O-acetyltransferase EpsC [Lacisediminihabitans sp.]|uniref:serine O-acetyltransferase EpsC n=1 Tax=Lacisediminihabitans sp. TaxID=2787631 RepID=UPI00374DEC64